MGTQEEEAAKMANMTDAEKKAYRKQKKAEKKAAKKAAKAAKNQKKQEMGGRGNVPVITTLADGDFGDLKCIQSRFKTGRQLVPVDQLTKALDGQTVWVRGRVHTTRAKGKTAFIVLRRGLGTVQACFMTGDIPQEMVKYAAKIPPESVVDVQAIVSVPPQAITGTTAQVELQVRKIYAVSIAISNVPFQMTDAMTPDHLLEAKESKTESKEGAIGVGQSLRLDNRCLDLRTPANHAIFRLQSRVGQYFRQYFLDKNFVEIHTPKLTPGVSEGGADVFTTNYFGKVSCLAQSPQLYKQMASVCGDLYKVFEIGPVFRAENSNTHRHLCEFVGLDFEMEIVEHYHEVLDVLANLFVYIFNQLNENDQALLETVRAQHPFEPLQYSQDTLVLTHREAVDMLKAEGVEIGYYDDFSTPQEKLVGKLVKAKFNTDFYIIDQYPLAARPFYTMPNADDPLYTNSYDVFLRGEEITSGAQRIHEVALLKKRATECEIPLDNIEGYTDSFAWGVPPHGGAGIGLERVVMLFMGLPNVRKSSMFPRDPTRLVP